MNPIIVSIRGSPSR